MSAPLVPSPLDYVGRRKFAVYPPIRNAGPNEWLLRSGSWSEISIVNAQTGEGMWLSRQYVGGVSDKTGFVLVVELTKELEYSEGVVSPVVKRVIEMPAPIETPRKKRRRKSGPAQVVGIRVEESDTAGLRVAAQIALGILMLTVVCAIVAAIAKL